MNDQTQPESSPPTIMRITLQGPFADALRLAAAHDRRSVSNFVRVCLQDIPEVVAALGVVESRQSSAPASSALGADELYPSEAN